MKAKALHFSKKELASEVSAELGRVYECVNDKIPPAYPCENEKVVFVGVEMSGRLDKKVEAFLKDLNPTRTKNVAFYTVNKDGSTAGFEAITKVLEANGVNVVAPVYNVKCVSSLFKSSVSDEEIQKAVAWAKDVIDNKLAQ